ncbi:hypothetical protein L484_027176 [Morus notabilis]|uniref:Uncharacterized protein n=1 Tax=Morus notabilis TaxID=981085 RepID=W9S952_9ROSA|nr:hypothetical protein L484_027176 [Morus notabilis]
MTEKMDLSIPPMAAAEPTPHKESSPSGLHLCLMSRGLRLGWCCGSVSENAGLREHGLKRCMWGEEARFTGKTWVQKECLWAEVAWRWGRGSVRGDNLGSEGVSVGGGGLGSEAVSEGKGGSVCEENLGSEGVSVGRRWLEGGGGEARFAWKTWFQKEYLWAREEARFARKTWFQKEFLWVEVAWGPKWCPWGEKSRFAGKTRVQKEWLWAEVVGEEVWGLRRCLRAEKCQRLGGTTTILDGSFRFYRST